MSPNDPGKFTKLAHSLPWLLRYPFWRARELAQRLTEGHVATPHLIVMVANHFEPGWNERNANLDWSRQLSRLEDWCEQAQAMGEAVRDFDGTPFRHTNFYPAEQYYAPILERLAQLQRDGFGEVEVHLHHGVDQPDNAAGLRRVLTEFRDTLAEEHRCLSREHGVGMPKYAFVHGNWALGNSAGGKYCGVDEEMEILAETGCYADFTLPSAPDETQVSRINAIYECGHALSRPRPHRSGPGLRVGTAPKLPIIFNGPLVFGGNRRFHGLPVPRFDAGALTAKGALDIDRLRRWAGARIGVLGRPEWIFIKLFCHGFFDSDQEAVIGGRMRHFWQEALEFADRTSAFRIHFVCAREAFNIAIAAVDGCEGNPNQYRDYRLRLIK